jgi:hypothetical protein
MKKTLLSIVLLASICSVRGQESATLPLKDANQIWSVTEMVLRERNIPMMSFSAFAHVFISAPFEYSVLTIRNRACYRISVSSSTVTADLTNREFFNGTAWVSNPAGISDATKDELLKPLVQRIAAISNDMGLVNTACNQSVLYPVYVNAVTVNDLTMYINDSRVIGDRIMLSGRFESSRPMNIRSMNEIKAITANGTELRTNRGTFAGEETNYLGQVNRAMEPGIPVPFDMVFEAQGEKTDQIQICSLQMYEPDKTKFKFFSIPLPMKVDMNLKPGVLETQKNVYMTFRKQETVEGKLRIHFSAENKSGKMKVFYPINFTVTDMNGLQTKQKDVFIGGNKQYSGFQLPPDIQVSGYVDFETAVPFDSIQLLQFAELQGAKFSVKKIVLVP